MAVSGETFPASSSGPRNHLPWPYLEPGQGRWPETPKVRAPVGFQEPSRARGSTAAAMDGDPRDALLNLPSRQRGRQPSPSFPIFDVMQGFLLF